jgi:hypothetical protein
MVKENQLTDDRVIPLSPALALFLGYLPGVDDRNQREKKASTHRRDKGIMTSQRGVNRALVLTQLNHRLKDSAPTDRRLFSSEEARWYARSYREWHTWDFCFMTYATMVRTFQDLMAAGYVVARREVEFTQADERITDRRSLMRVMGVYNGKCFSIDYPKLEQAMLADERVQAYYRLMFPARTAPEDDEATSDRPDHTRDRGDHTRDRGDHTRDRGDHTPEIGAITGRDRGDHTPEIGAITPPRSGRSEIISSKSAVHQQDQAGPSSSSGPPGPEPDSRKGDDPEPESSPAPGLGYTKAYALLTRYGIEHTKADELAKTSTPDCVEAWIDYIWLPNAERKRTIENKVGYLIKMLTQVGAWPPGHKRSAAEQAAPAPGRRFLNGPHRDEITH